MKETTKVTIDTIQEKSWTEMTPKKQGVLDMVIAFDTTGSMAAYIDDVRLQVTDLIPRLFKDNENLRLGIVAFGDYCDMKSKYEFGDAYQCLMPTNNVNEIMRFICNTKDTCGGDSDEFYELVIKKIVNETPWREGSTRSILLISDAEPHRLGYSYGNIIRNNRISWRKEAYKAAKRCIKIDTVTIHPLPWYRELSRITNGVCAPFSSSHRTSELVVAATLSRGSEKQRRIFDEMNLCCDEPEMAAVYESYRREREDVD